MELILIGGRSGAGKTTVMHLLEDLGCYYLDNIPSTILVNTITELAKHERYRKVVVGLDSGSFSEGEQLFDQVLSKLRKICQSLQIWMLDAEDDVLVTRYSETRRKHPFSTPDISLAEAMKREKILLEPLYKYADHCIDTSQFIISQLRSIIKSIYLGEVKTSQLQIQIFSFGFKYGVPSRADFIFDVRCLPNPYWQKSLRDFTGENIKVKKFLESYDVVHDMKKDIASFISRWLPHFFEQDRSYMDIGIGCTGGKHRSVYLAHAVADSLKDYSDLVIVNHREKLAWQKS